MDLPNLDDQSFEDIVQTARDSIHQLLPEWTDENAHDPGITLLELLGWLIESQQYQLNRITPQAERKFLKLLGVRPDPVQPALVDVEFSSPERVEALPPGLRVMGEEISFETITRVSLIPEKLVRVASVSDGRVTDVTTLNVDGRVAYFPFGETVLRGNTFLLGFNQALPRSTRLRMLLRKPGDRPGTGVPVQGDGMFIPSGKVSWWYYGRATESDVPGWVPLPVLHDETYHFSQTGYLTFRIDGWMEAWLQSDLSTEPLAWLKAQVEEPGYEMPPKIAKVAINVVPARQEETLCQVFEFQHSWKQEMVIDHCLAYYGDVSVLVLREPGKWQEYASTLQEDLPENLSANLSEGLSEGLSENLSEERFMAEPRVRVQRRASDRLTTVKLTGSAQVLDSVQRVRVLAKERSFTGYDRLGPTTGAPNLVLQLPFPFREDLRLMISEGLEEQVWEEWTRVEDFDASGPKDAHFVVHEEMHEIQFGDGIHGRCPYRSQVPNVRLVSAVISQGSQGNIQAGYLNRVDSPDPDLTDLSVRNASFAVGGTDSESLDGAKTRLENMWQEPGSAITNEDVERIVRSTPGVHVARVKVLPLYRPGISDYPKRTAPAQITVVVVPYAKSKTPAPSDGFVQTVWNQLNQYRLITTKIHVMAPVYVEVSVSATVVVEPDHTDMLPTLVHTLEQYLSPLPEGRFPGWEFGRAVFRGDIYSVLQHLLGVAYIQDLRMDAHGPGVMKDLDGDIRIPPHALVYSGSHQIEVVSRLDV